MDKTLQQELAEAWAAIKADSEGDWSGWLNNMLCESADVFAHFLDAIDDEDHVSELASLKRDISEMVELAIKNSGVKIPLLIRGAIPMIVRSGVEVAIEEITESGQTADEWCKKTLVPLIHDLDSTLLHWAMVLTRHRGG